MKSWGARLVAGLKNWRTRNSDAASDLTPYAGRGEQPDLEPIEKTSIKPTLTDFDEEASRANPINGGTTRPDQEPKKPVTGKVLTNRSGKASGKAASRTGSKSPSQVLQERSTDPLSQAREATEKNAATPGVPASRRSRLREPETSDELVTDEDLAELEAENARLKLLLQEKLPRR